MIGIYLLSEIAKRCEGELIGDDAEISAFSTDTRTMVVGDAFVALKGKNFDGNDLAVDAVKKGAAAVVVSRKMSVNLPMLYVDDALRALATISSITRERSSAKVIGITGSQGKTTVKEMIGSILSRVGTTLITPKNQNNTVGVPLTLLNLTKLHEYAVIEMGADRHGEIKFSAETAKPEIVVITNANEAHVDGFGSLLGIVKAKGEIIDAAPASGKVILNYDDPNVDVWIKRAGDRGIAKFSGLNPSANYFASNVCFGSMGAMKFDLNTPLGSQSISLALLGNHNVLNAVAAAAASMEAGADLREVKTGLEILKPVSGRLFPTQGINQCRVIDDSYNASPSSFRAAIDVFKNLSGTKILVAGDMRELGVKSDEFHRQVGRYAAISGIERLWAIGEHSRHMVADFGSGAKHFSSKDELINECRETAKRGFVFLIKGSRGSRMDSVVNALRIREGD